MSAPQTAQQQNITTHSKGPRKSPRKPQNGGQNARSVVSDNDAYNNLSEHKAGSGEGKARSRRKSHAVKKGHVQNDAAAYSDGSIAQRPATAHAKTHATPIKQQAYAGPTFHQSPAASALPLPSFYSKSLPIASPLKPALDGVPSPGKQVNELDQNKVPVLPSEPKRETTPLDFLFDAARKASATPGAESPNHRHYLSSAADTPVSRSPAAREGDADFPFELDSGDQISLENVSTASTPYKERIEAARNQRTPSVGGKGLDEDERKAKTAALKQFLLNSAQSQNNGSDNNPFNARPVPQHRPYQHRSNPNTPYNASAYGNAQQYFPPMPPMPHNAHYQSPSRPGPPSNLRKVYHPGPDTAANAASAAHPPEQHRISTARAQTPPRNNFADIYRTPDKSGNQGPGHRATPSAQQLEDDLRKFLKLDLVSSG